MFKLVLAISMVSYFAVPQIIKANEILTSVAEMLTQIGY